MNHSIHSSSIFEDLESFDVEMHYLQRRTSFSNMDIAEQDQTLKVKANFFSLATILSCVHQQRNSSCVAVADQCGKQQKQNISHKEQDSNTT